MAEEETAARRVYAEIKQRILQGVLPVRVRIDLEKLATEFGVSVLPVRQALAQLGWEHLVRPSASQGYRVFFWSIAELAALYEWRGLLAVAAYETALPDPEIARACRLQPYPQALWSLGRALEQGANPEIQLAARAADERLYIARQAEEDVLGDAGGELEVLGQALALRSKRARPLLRAFHRRRSHSAERIRARVALLALPSNGGEV